SSRSFISRREQALSFRPIQGAIERTGEPVEQRVDLRGRDDQRWTDREHVANYEAHDQLLLFGEAHRARADTRFRVERGLGPAVGDKLNGANEPEAARLSDQRMLAERGEAGLELRRFARRLLGDALARVDVERLERHRRRDRMAGISETVGKRADLAALLQ